MDPERREPSASTNSPKQLLHNMADIDDMVDGLTDAPKNEDCDDRDATAHRQARAYNPTQIVLTAAMQQHQLIEEQMTSFLASEVRARAGALAVRKITT
jgi:hypothetical protein